MQRFRAKIVCRKTPRRTVICTLCGAVWEERFIGVRTATGQPAPVCPRCIPPMLTADGMIEAEISMSLLSADADPATIRRTATERYGQFLSERAPFSRAAVAARNR